MASINGLSPSLITSSTRTNKTSKNKKVKKSHTQQPIGHPSKVADAVAQSIKYVDESQIHRAQVQYDLPEGKARKAMEQYMDVMNQAKKEELAQLLGVDIYV